MVSAGLDVPTDGMLPQPTAYKFGWSQQRWKESTTELVGSPPMMCVPAPCPAPA